MRQRTPSIRKPKSRTPGVYLRLLDRVSRKSQTITVDGIGAPELRRAIISAIEKGTIFPQMTRDLGVAE